MFYSLYVVYLYTNLEFTNDEKDDPATLYDALCSSGMIEAIFNALHPTERSMLEEILYDTMTLKLEYRNTIASVINSFIDNLPVNAKEAKDIIEKFNPQDFMQVLNFAQAANGNRPIN